MDGLVKAAGQGESLPTRVTTTIFPRDEALHDAPLAWQRLQAQVPTGAPITAIAFSLNHVGQLITRAADVFAVGGSCRCGGSRRPDWGRG